MRTKSPTISVVIPTYNRLERLRLAIDSVLNQTYPVHELFVVDDGSTDGTSEWVSQHYPQIRLITQKNHGVSHARNRAIEQTTGEWVALLDSDDHWYAQKIQNQVNAIIASPDHRLCHCDEHWIRNGKRVNPKHKHRKHGGDVFSHCLPLCVISPSAAMLHQSLWSDIGLFDEALPACEDYDLWLRISARENVLYVDEPLLEKTGGHEDQLSQRYPAMDQFRLTALAKLIRSNALSKQQAQMALLTFRSKLTIFCKGARKRARHDVVDAMCDNYRDLMGTGLIL